MADYNLHGLNPRDFQHMVQAICRKVISNGVTPFGDGRDGARDLSHRGKMAFPSSGPNWEGYLIVGCKFQQRPTGDVAKDAAWAIKHVQKDLAKFKGRQRSVAKPEYYLLVTNVALSSVPQSGGRDRVLRALEASATELHLKGYAVWDYNDLRTFLDGDSDIRRAYGHLVTTGDVLTAILSRIATTPPHLLSAMHVFLQKELVADAAAKLQSAGEDPDVQVPLANVFVDLPFADTSTAKPMDREPSQRPKIVATLLDACRTVARPRLGGGETFVVAPGKSRRPSTWYVVVGGPGQGKSTLSQFICQLFRAALLKDREHLDTRIPGIIRELQRQPASSTEALLVRRFPVRIELRQFANALASDEQLTLADYIRRDMMRLGAIDVTRADLRLWLSEAPWLLVLDGLDEVPPSSNRARVLQEIDAFTIEAASASADLMIIATTRPQSYNNEFSGDRYRHFFLAPLAPGDALAYGQRLATVRCASDPRRKDDLIRSLEKACETSSTSLLMQSPLQVTIMATLLEDTGDPPQQRYRLFAEYYRTIYKRETRRMLLDGVLSERQKDIDTIHAEAGVLLQSDGESPTSPQSAEGVDGVDSALTDSQFQHLVRRRLTSIGVPDDQVRRLLERVSDGSLQRLVFLVRPREGWVRFDITSFKEFMAAEGLMNGTDENVRGRLRAIAAASYWRNVFLFAVGKCFVEREHLLDTVVTLCVALNEESGAKAMLQGPVAPRCASAVLWGSRLALSVLEDGTARQHPKYEGSFARIALGLTKLADSEAAARLSNVYHTGLAEQFKSVSEERLGQAQEWSRLGVYYLLAELTEQGVGWAQSLLAGAWPVDKEIQRRVCTPHKRPPRTEFLAERLAVLLPQIDPQNAYHLSRQPRVRHDSLSALAAGARGEFGRLQCEVRCAWRDLVPFVSVVGTQHNSESATTLLGTAATHMEWQVIQAGLRFAASPSPRSLAAELRRLGVLGHDLRDLRWQHTLPWPIAACAARTKSYSLEELAGMAEKGHLGDSKHWHLAEQRWQRDGLTEHDFADGDFVEVGGGIGERGFPFAACGVSLLNLQDDMSRESVSAFLGRLDRVANPFAKSWLAASFAWATPGSSRIEMTPSEVRQLVRLGRAGSHGSEKVPMSFVLACVPPDALDHEWLHLLNDVADDVDGWLSDPPPTSLSDALAAPFCQEPERFPGLVTYLTAFSRAGTTPKVTKSALDACVSTGRTNLGDIFSLAFANGLVDDLPTALQGLSVEHTARALRTASSLSSTSPLVSVALLALSVRQRYADIDKASTDMGVRATEALMRFLTTQPSRLQGDTEWTTLQLPPRLPSDVR